MNQLASIPSPFLALPVLSALLWTSYPVFSVLVAAAELGFFVQDQLEEVCPPFVLSFMLSPAHLHLLLH